MQIDAVKGRVDPEIVLEAGLLLVLFVMRLQLKHAFALRERRGIDQRCTDCELTVRRSRLLQLEYLGRLDVPNMHLLPPLYRDAFAAGAQVELPHGARRRV